MAKYPFLLRIGAFWGILLGLWVPLALPIYLIYQSASTTFLIILLYGLFTGLVWAWGRKVEGKENPFNYYGLATRNRSFFLEFLIAFSLGFGALFLLMESQVGLGWLSWNHFAKWHEAVVSGILTGISVGLAEELLFRGWLLTEMEKDFGQKRSLLLNSSFFAITHFIRIEPLEIFLSRLIQFPGLMLLGIALILARRSQKGSLGAAIGLHGGLVSSLYLINTSEWIKSNKVVPEWITGIGGNPLAGIMGLLSLGAIATIIQTKVLKRFFM